jgi:hypothetical protein
VGRAFALTLLEQEGLAMRLYRQLAGLIVLWCLATAALAQARTNIGVLTCTLGDQPGRNMTCGFKPTGSGAEERYAGTIRRRDQGMATGKLVLVWAVIGPADTKLSAGILAQRFAKSGSASGQPPTLVGETNSSIVLQFETSNGTEVSDAITQVELRLTTTPA